MSNQIDPVAAAIAAAQGAANTTALAPSTAPTMSEVSAPVAAGKPLSLADALSMQGSACDVYIQVDKAGITIDKDDSTYFDSLDVEVCLRDVRPVFSVRFSRAGQTEYFRSYDGVKEARTGKAWQVALQEASRLDPKCNGQYLAYEFVATLAQDYTTKAGKTFAAGTKVGHSTSITGSKTFGAWVADVFGKHSPDEQLAVRIGFRKMEKGQNKWGVLVVTNLVAA